MMGVQVLLRDLIAFTACIDFADMGHYTDRF